ncbi:hypothetical protein B0E45_07185 [Sinorhizobium sp. A49]|nr:hypothetical protein B0E45_07185 [Sinorhizobium sp. A49]
MSAVTIYPHLPAQCAFHSSLPPPGIIKFNHCISAIELLGRGEAPICPAQYDSRARLGARDDRYIKFEMLHVALIELDRRPHAAGAETWRRGRNP